MPKAARHLLQFTALTPTFRNGVSLAVGDVNNDGLAEIVVGAGPSGNSQVQVFDSTLGKLQKQFQAFTTNTTAAVRLAAIDPDGAGVDGIYAVQASGGASHQVKLFDPLGAVAGRFLHRKSARLRRRVRFGLMPVGASTSGAASSIFNQRQPLPIHGRSRWPMRAGSTAPKKALSWPA